jgi:hypothetical protein
MNAAALTFGKELVQSKSWWAQLIFFVVGWLVLRAIMTAVDVMVRYYKRYGQMHTVLIEHTTTSDQQRRFFQDPANIAAKTMWPSANELQGVEFSYATWLNIKPSTVSAGQSGLKHIYHKGSTNASCFPLMAPGIFVKANDNVMRVFMNTYSKWDDYVDVTNVPINKWFHFVVTVTGKDLTVYINGNIVRRHVLSGVPRLNHGDGIAFMAGANQKMRNGPESEDFNLLGAFSGQASRMQYYAYALSFSEIDGLVREGPSSKMDDTALTNTPPYNADDWWVNVYTRPGGLQPPTIA